MSGSGSGAPAGGFGVEHPLERGDAPLHAARDGVKLAQRILVRGGQFAAPAPAREIVRDDPDRRDDGEEDEAEDEGEDAAHGDRHHAGGLMRLPSRAFKAASSSSTRTSFS